MGKRMHRAQILMETEQHQALAEFARREGRSISEVVRKIIATWLADQETNRVWRRQMAARRALQGIRDNIRGRYQTIGEDLGTDPRADLV